MEVALQSAYGSFLRPAANGGVKQRLVGRWLLHLEQVVGQAHECISAVQKVHLRNVAPKELASGWKGLPKPCAVETGPLLRVPDAYTVHGREGLHWVCDVAFEAGAKDPTVWVFAAAMSGTNRGFGRRVRARPLGGLPSQLARLQPPGDRVRRPAGRGG